MAVVKQEYLKDGDDIISPITSIESVYGGLKELKRITSSELDSLAIKEGQFIICTDTNKAYVDVDNSTRVPISGAEIPINPTDTTNLNLWIESH